MKKYFEKTQILINLEKIILEINLIAIKGGIIHSFVPLLPFLVKNVKYKIIFFINLHSILLFFAPSNRTDGSTLFIDEYLLKINKKFEKNLSLLILLNKTVLTSST